MPATGAVVVGDLTVQLPAAISGLVTDSVSSDPLPFIYVEAYTATDPRNYLGSATTDLLGRYRIGGLGNTPLVLRFTDPYGAYVRTLNNGGDPVTWSPQTPITLAEAQELAYDQPLVPKAPPTPPTHNLSGTVTDADHQPLAGIVVTFGDQGDETDRQGHWFIDSPDGTHTLDFGPSGTWTDAFPGEPTWAGESFPVGSCHPPPLPSRSPVASAPPGLDISLVRSVTNTVVPAITGTAAPGQTLTATSGTWLAPTGTTFATAWKRDGVPVGTGPTYLVTPGRRRPAAVRHGDRDLRGRCDSRRQRLRAPWAG